MARDAATAAAAGLQPPVSPARATFEDVVLPHLDAAYRLARWLLRNEHDAEDVVQEACLRALRYFGTFAGRDGRAWFLTIVRNACANARGRRNEALSDSFDEERHLAEEPASNPETMLLQIDDAALIARALRNLPERSRELLVLRELEELSYKELAEVVGVPIGTVMSGLSRARRAMRDALVKELTLSAASREPVTDREGDTVGV